jgi:hypothetical protein
LLEYILAKEDFSRYISLGTPGWEIRLKHTIAAIATAYHSGLLKLKAGPGWVEVGLSDEQEKYYNIIIQRFSSLPDAEKFILNRLLAGMCNSLAKSHDGHS